MMYRGDISELKVLLAKNKKCRTLSMYIFFDLWVAFDFEILELL